MKHSYTMQGMTCNGCRTGVENKLNQIGAILKAEVNLDKEEAVIEMNKHILMQELQNS